MRHVVLLWLLLLAVSVRAEPEVRVASLSLCADQVLIELLPPEQIAALTPESQDPNMSYLADRAAALPVLERHTEYVLKLRPSLILTAPYSVPTVVQQLQRLSLDTTLLSTKNPVTLDGVPAFVRHIASALPAAARERAEQLIADYQRQLAVLDASLPPDGEWPRVAIYSPNGITIGADTLEDDILRRAGYRNAASLAGITGFRHISLETLISWQPDYLLLDNITYNQDSLSHAYLHHPVLARLVGERRLLQIPSNLRACPGLMSVQAATTLARQR